MRRYGRSNGRPTRTSNSRKNESVFASIFSHPYFLSCKQRWKISMQVTSLHCYVGVHRHVSWKIKDNLSSIFCLVLAFFMECMYGMLQISGYWTDFVRLPDKIHTHIHMHIHQGAQGDNSRKGTPQTISFPGCTSPSEAHSTSPEKPSSRMAGRNST